MHLLYDFTFNYFELSTHWFQSHWIRGISHRSESSLCLRLSENIKVQPVTVHIKTSHLPPPSFFLIHLGFSYLPIMGLVFPSDTQSFIFPQIWDFLKSLQGSVFSVLVEKGSREAYGPRGHCSPFLGSLRERGEVHMLTVPFLVPFILCGAQASQLARASVIGTSPPPNPAIIQPRSHANSTQRLEDSKIMLLGRS